MPATRPPSTSPASAGGSCSGTPTSWTGSAASPSCCPGRSRSCCATTPRCRCSSAGCWRTRRSAGWRCPRGPSWGCCSARPTATRPCSPSPTGSTWAGPRRPSTSASGPGSTTAWGRRWAAWSWSCRSGPCWLACPGWSRPPSRPGSRPTSCAAWRRCMSPSEEANPFAMYGPELTFLGVPRADLEDPASLAGADVVVVGAPFDGGTSNRPGARFGPSAIRGTDYLAHDGSRPSLALDVDALRDLNVVDAGDVLMLAGEIQPALERLERAVHAVAAAGAIPVVLGGDHTIALPDVTGVARHHGMGRVSVVHFDAHADTGDTQFGSLLGHGTPMRRLIESGAARGDRFLQLGLRG